MMVDLLCLVRRDTPFKGRSGVLRCRSHDSLTGRLESEKKNRGQRVNELKHPWSSE